jgi:hypothetical protein
MQEQPWRRACAERIWVGWAAEELGGWTLGQPCLWCSKRNILAKTASSAYAACASSSFFNSKIQGIAQKDFRPVRAKRTNAVAA